MKTTKRSKMLLSSIAMLLVALVALGSATFAWYSINRTVTAQEINVKASTPGGLEISLDNSNWATSVDLVGMSASGGKVLEPAQLTFGTTGVTNAIYADGAASDASASTGSTVDVTATGEGTYWVVDEIYVRSSSSKAGNVQAQVKATGTNTNSFIHLAVVDAADGTLLGGEQDASALTSGTFANLGSAVAYAAAGATTKHYYVVAWAAGNDTDCYTDNANKTNAIEWDLKFTLADA